MSTTGLGRSQGGVSTTGVGLPLTGWSVYNRCRVTSHTVECPQQMGLSYGGVSTTDVQLPLATGRSVSTTHVQLPLAVGGSVYSGCETTSRRWLSDYFFFLSQVTGACTAVISDALARRVASCASVRHSRLAARGLLLRLQPARVST